MYKKILCTLDGSELAEQALPHALAMAKAFDAEITLLRVVEPPPLPLLPEFAAAEIDILPQLEEDAKKYITAKVEELKQAGYKVVGVIEEGRAADAIADFSREHGMDLIVMATHGRSGLSRWAFGSVADRVLRLSCCPILLIRAQKKS